MNDQANEAADHVMAIERGIEPAWFGFDTNAEAVSFEQLYEGSAAVFWAKHEDDEPNAFEEALARSLAEFERVCHLKTRDRACEAGVELTEAEGLSEKLWRLWDRPGPVRPSCGSDTGEIFPMFNQTGFNWSLQWQRAFISDNTIDTLDRKLAASMPDVFAPNGFRDLWEAVMDRYLVPGIDGACAAFFASRHQECERFAQSLATALRELGLPHRNTYPLETRSR